MDDLLAVRSDRCELLCLDLERAEALRRTRLELREARRVAGRAHALGDPTRIQLAIALREAGELCVCDLAWIVERSDAVVSHHLRKMRLAEVVASRREKKMVMYQLTSVGSELLNSLAFSELAERGEAS